MYVSVCQQDLAEENGTKFEGSGLAWKFSPLAITWDTAELHFSRPQLKVESELRAT
jgi:hypothetical protein